MVDAIKALFPDARIQGGYARVRCPYHKGGHEAKPSMSILLEQRGNAPAGLCHCFACGKAVMLQQLIKDVGSDIELDTAAQCSSTRQNVQLKTTQPMLKAQLPYRKSKYLESRGIGEDTQEKFRIYEKDKKVYMPVFDRYGFYMYANARSTETKHFYVEEGAVKTLWGIEEIDLSKPIAVCESQIDALSFWEVGMQAVATLGADNTRSLELIKGCTSIIVLAFDPDDAGRKARDKASAMLGKFRCRWLDLPEGVDVNKALQDIGDKKKFKDFMNRCMRSFVQ